MPFVKGQSGNPGGRPKVNVEFQRRCRQVVDERVISMWAAEVESQGPEWVRCSELLAAYGYGKPSQSVALTGADGGPIEIDRRVTELSDAALDRLIAASAAEGEGAPH